MRSLAGLPHLRIHDLRHASVRIAAAAVESLHIIDKMLRHRDTSTTQGYARLAPEPVQAAATRAGERMQALLAGGAGEVVPLPIRPRRCKGVTDLVLYSIEPLDGF